MQSKETVPFMNWWSTTKNIFHSYGWRGFTRGLFPCFIRSIPACGMMFTTVDFIRSHFFEHQKQSQSQRSVTAAPAPSHLSSPNYILSPAFFSFDSTSSSPSAVSSSSPTSFSVQTKVSVDRYKFFGYY
jgi:hypothetical protein